MRSRSGGRSGVRRAVAAAVAVLTAAAGTIVVTGPASAGRRAMTVVSDDAPAVVGTSPLDADYDIAVDADIVVDFTEPVTLVSPSDWLTVECAESGAHEGTTTGIGDTRTFDPDVDFAFDEECVAVVHGTAIADSDTIDPPDAMDADVEIYFATTSSGTDDVDPVVDVTHAPDGSNGWNTSAPVAVHVTAADNVGVTALSCTVDGSPVASTPAFAAGTAYAGSVAVAGEGTHHVVCGAADAAGNTATGPDLDETVRIDTVAPVSTVTGFTDGQMFLTGVDPMPEVGCTTTDAVPGSGPGTTASATTDVSGVNANGVGTVVVTCDGGTDVAGNGDATASAAYVIGYSGIGGILAPIASDGPGVVQRGRTVPVKFRVGAPPTRYDVTGWWVARRPVSCTTLAPLGPESPARSTGGGGLRYDADAGQYVFDADLRGEPTGSCWQVRARFDTGQVTGWSRAFRLTR